MSAVSEDHEEKKSFVFAECFCVQEKKSILFVPPTSPSCHQCYLLQRPNRKHHCGGKETNTSDYNIQHGAVCFYQTGWGVTSLWNDKTK